MNTQIRVPIPRPDPVEPVLRATPEHELQLAPEQIREDPEDDEEVEADEEADQQVSGHGCGILSEPPGRGNRAAAARPADEWTVTVECIAPERPSNSISTLALELDLYVAPPPNSQAIPSSARLDLESDRSLSH